MSKKNKVLKGLAIGLLGVVTLGCVVGITNQTTGWVDNIVDKTEAAINVNFKEGYFKADYLGEEATEFADNFKYGRFTFNSLENEPMSLIKREAYPNLDESQGKMALHVSGEGSYTYGSITIKTFGVSKLRLLVDNCADLYIVGPGLKSTEFYNNFYAYRNVDTQDSPKVIEFNLEEANEYTIASLNDFDLLNIEIID